MACATKDIQRAVNNGVRDCHDLEFCDVQMLGFSCDALHKKPHCLKEGNSFRKCIRFVPVLNICLRRWNIMILEYHGTNVIVPKASKWFLAVIGIETTHNDEESMGTCPF